MTSASVALAGCQKEKEPENPPPNPNVVYDPTPLILDFPEPITVAI